MQLVEFKRSESILGQAGVSIFISIVESASFHRSHSNDRDASWRESILRPHVHTAWMLVCNHGWDAIVIDGS